MPPKVPIEVKKLIVSWYYSDDEPLTMAQIATRAQVSIGLVSKTLKTFREHGTFENPCKLPTGAHRILTDEDMFYIKCVYEANNGIYLDELQQKLLSIRNVDVSVATLSRTISKVMRLTRKKVSKAAAERDEALRAVWQTEMVQYEADMIVALDKSAVDSRTPQRPEGRSLEGTPCVRRATFIRSKRHSVLPAITTSGIIALEIFEGSVNRERFLRFLNEKVAPQLNPYPGKNSVVLMDNCSDERVARAAVEWPARPSFSNFPKYKAGSATERVMERNGARSGSRGRVWARAASSEAIGAGLDASSRPEKSGRGCESSGKHGGTRVERLRGGNGTTCRAADSDARRVPIAASESSEKVRSAEIEGVGRLANSASVFWGWREEFSGGFACQCQN